MKMRRRGLGYGVFVLVLALTLEAHAILINDVNDDFGVGYSVVTPGGQSLMASGTFNVQSISPTLVQLQVTIQNTTNASFGTNVSAIGFNTNPAVTASFASAGSVFDGVLNNVNFPAVSNPISVCVFTGANCSASPFGQGLGPGSGTFTNTFALNLAGSFGSTPSLTLSTFAIKFAGDLGSFETQGVVPIPGTFLLFGAGFAGLVAWQSRHGRREQEQHLPVT
jgi:hypothetical protein